LFIYIYTYTYTIGPKETSLSASNMTKDLKEFLYKSHMDNFTTVLCSAMRQGLVMAPTDIQLGSFICVYIFMCMSIYVYICMYIYT
jgi:hypothetical protein